MIYLKKHKIFAASFALVILTAFVFGGISNKRIVERKVVKDVHGEFMVQFSKDRVGILTEGEKTVGSYLELEGDKIFEYIVSGRKDYCDEEILLICGGEGAEYGDKLIVAGIGLGGLLGEKFRLSMKDMNPHDLKLADIDGDGEYEISITMYKKTRFHPVMARRPYIYRWEEDGIYPMWRGSRLSRPFKKYVFCDIDGEQGDEIVAIEHLEDGGNIVNAYSWKGFGFESIAQSKEFHFIEDVKTCEDKGVFNILARTGKGDEEMWMRGEYTGCDDIVFDCE